MLFNADTETGTRTKRKNVGVLFLNFFSYTYIKRA